jgi:excisionase family DNA binding protein
MEVLMATRHQESTPRSEAGETFAAFGAAYRSVATKPSVPGLKLLLSPAEAAAALSISRSKVYRLLREGRLESIMLDGNRRITVACLEQFVDALLDVTAPRDNGTSQARIGHRRNQ